jgi:rhodanese-related sulfurtransferase
MLSILKDLFKKNYESLDGRTFKEKFRADKNAVLIDVRTPAEFSGGSIRGARNINIMSPSFRQNVQNLDKNKSYYLFCRSGARSGSACNQMSKMGFRVYNLSGGIGAWPN